MPLVRAACVGLLLAGVACGRGASSEPRQPAPAIVVSPPTDSPVEPVSRVAEPALPEDAAFLDDLGIAVVLPPGAGRDHQVKTRRHVVTLAPHLIVELQFVGQPAPRSVAELQAAWGMPGSDELGRGDPQDGVRHLALAFEVRIGFEGMPGQTIHTFKRVARVYAVLPLGAESHVLCTGYIEREVASSADPDLERVRSLCLSMRKR